MMYLAVGQLLVLSSVLKSAYSIGEIAVQNQQQYCAKFPKFLCRLPCVLPSSNSFAVLQCCSSLV